jgi:hypothetical protein
MLNKTFHEAGTDEHWESSQIPKESQAPSGSSDFAVIRRIYECPTVGCGLAALDFPIHKIHYNNAANFPDSGRNLCNVGGFTQVIPTKFSEIVEYVVGLII